MHSFTPKRCAATGKIMYHSKATAEQAADRCFVERGVELWTYRCGTCGTWHLTSHSPDTAWVHAPLNQQIRPHSRKKGYKPRRR